MLDAPEDFSTDDFPFNITLFIQADSYHVPLLADDLFRWLHDQPPSSTNFWADAVSSTSSLMPLCMPTSDFSSAERIASRHTRMEEKNQRLPLCEHAKDQ